MDPGTCSVAEAINKLGCENNSPDGRGNKVRDQDAGGSLNPLLLGHNGPASGKRPPSLITTEPEIRADQLPAPRSQERELETTHSLVAPSALGRHANEAAQRYLATTEGKMCEDLVWNWQMTDFPDGSPHLPKMALPARPVELTHETLEVDQVLGRQYRMARVDHTQVLSNLMSSAHGYTGVPPQKRKYQLAGLALAAAQAKFCKQVQGSSKMMHAHPSLPNSMHVYRRGGKLEKMPTETHWS